MLKISANERKYLVDGVSQNIRNDGRGNMDYRHLQLETSIISQTNGSARLKLGNYTDILVGIKLETGQPDPDTPKEGKVQFAVECVASASPEFQGRGAEELNLELASVLERLMVMDLKQLCIIPGKLCWILYVDAIVFESGGNLFDAISIATIAALHNTQIPTVEVNEELGEFEVSDDPENCTRLQIESVPVCVTFTRIGGSYVVDATLEEELCMSMRLTMAINRKGNLCAMQKGGQGGLDPSSVNEMLHNARKIASSLLTKLSDVLAAEEANRIPTVGFFAQ